MVSWAFSVLSEVPLKDALQGVNRAMNMSNNRLNTRIVRLFIDTSEI